jgi:hypothetical protein
MRNSGGHRVHSGRHVWTRWLLWGIRDFDQFEIQDQIGSGGNRRQGGATGGKIPITKSQLPWNEDAALAFGLHAYRSHIPTDKRTSLSHDRRPGLRIAQLGLAVVTHHRFAVFVFERRSRVIVGRVKFGAISC